MKKTFLTLMLSASFLVNANDVSQSEESVEHAAPSSTANQNSTP